MRDSSYEKQQENSQANDRELPPLPQRALQGLVRPWITPNGSPFHTVRLWEFPFLYVNLKFDLWTKFSTKLQNINNLAAFSRKYQLSRSVLANIRDNFSQSIKVDILWKLSKAFDFDLDLVEKSVNSVMFNFCGEKEFISFPFTMDIYAWRAICHIPGDGNIHCRKKTHNRKTNYPDLRWTQWPAKGEVLHQELPPRTQRFMRCLLERLSRYPGGYGKNVNYPKALAYTIMGTMPGITLDDLRTPKFIQFIIDLPPKYREFKIEFLIAFAIDDSGIKSSINFFQSSKQKLLLIQALCLQLKYDCSDVSYLHERDQVWSFRLLLKGVRDLNRDLKIIQSNYRNDPLLGIWHKTHLLEKISDNISEKRLNENDQAVVVYETIIQVMNDNTIRKTPEIRNHPAIKTLVQNYIDKIFNDRIRLLNTFGILKEVKKTKKKSYRPKRWYIPSGEDIETLLQKFHDSYGRRNHRHSYKRRPVTLKIAQEAIEKVQAMGEKPTPTNIGRVGGFSRRLFYERADLRALLENCEIV